MQLTNTIKTKRQIVPVHWKDAATVTYHDLCNPQGSVVKALIIYDDIACAGNTNAVLHHALRQADVTVKWDVKPWRLDMLKFQPTAGQALTDALEARLLVFAVRRTGSIPAWLIAWLEEWAALRQAPDAALAVIGDGDPESPSATATVELFQFARQRGVTFICDDDGEIDDQLPFRNGSLNERQPSGLPALPHFRHLPIHAVYHAWGINE